MTSLIGTNDALYSLAPKAFPIVYNMFKNFIDEETRKKIVVWGSKSIIVSNVTVIIFVTANWKEELQQYISPDQLPQLWWYKM